MSDLSFSAPELHGLPHAGATDSAEWAVAMGRGNLTRTVAAAALGLAALLIAALGRCLSGRRALGRRKYSAHQRHALQVT